MYLPAWKHGLDALGRPGRDRGIGPVLVFGGRHQDFCVRKIGALVSFAINPLM
jgi:hypothetical protein